MKLVLLAITTDIKKFKWTEYCERDIKQMFN